MSGGGSSYSSDPSPSCDCDKLVFTAILQSPKLTVTKLLIVGDRLQLEKKGPQGPVVAVHKKHGDAGSVVSKIVDLLRCIDDGFEYEATIKEITGQRVRVEVRPI